METIDTELKCHCGGEILYTTYPHKGMPPSAWCKRCGILYYTGWVLNNTRALPIAEELRAIARAEENRRRRAEEETTKTNRF